MSTPFKPLFRDAGHAAQAKYMPQLDARTRDPADLIPPEYRWVLDLEPGAGLGRAERRARQPVARQQMQVAYRRELELVLARFRQAIRGDRPWQQQEIRGQIAAIHDRTGKASARELVQSIVELRTLTKAIPG